jgi:serine/threonine protein kinase
VRAQEAEREREYAIRRAREEKGVAEIKRQESEEKLQQLQTQWVVEREEIQLTDQELGRGAWATVCVAKFRGARVAAKCVHNQIVSPHNIQLFKREMEMATKIRHPNLLLFIGATLEGEMVILTEIMPTSLRKELERDYMSVRPAVSISLDVLRALNYLHLMRPHPLIHRDISSANVLLDPLPNGCWRAKVSDYGTVNLQENLATIGPGSPCYAAPEANDPNQQSPKMDIFSFGALLMEILSGKNYRLRTEPEVCNILVPWQYLLTDLAFRPAMHQGECASYRPAIADDCGWPIQTVMVQV